MLFSVEIVRQWRELPLVILESVWLGDISVSGVFCQVGLVVLSGLQVRPEDEGKVAPYS